VIRLFLAAVFLLVGCGDDAVPPVEPQAGDACSNSADCGDLMKCIGQVCQASEPVADGASDTSVDVVVEPDGPGLAAQDSYYTLSVTLMDGSGYEVERDLEGKETVFSFGSSHIGTAVAFSVEDTISFPTFMIVTMDFGKVVGSVDWPRHIFEVGEYPFTDGAPSLEVQVMGLSFASTRAESTGGYVITEFGSQTGQVMSGTISGRIWHDKDDPIQYLNVEGVFHFTLPAKGKNS
jgi:hypothetical protein